MKKTCLALVAIMACLTGCVPVDSLNPLYTDKDVVFDETLLGFWVGPDNGSEGGIEFSDLIVHGNKPLAEGDRVYVLTMYDKARDSAEGSKAVYHAHLVNLGGRRFLDVVPEQWDARAESYSLQIKQGKGGASIEPRLLRIASSAYLEFSAAGGKTQADLRRAHWIMKLVQHDKTLKIDWADDDDFRKAVEAGKVHLPNALLGGGKNGEGKNKDVVITATTPELQKFVVEHADDSTFFSSKTGELHRKE